MSKVFRQSTSGIQSVAHRSWYYVYKYESTQALLRNRNIVNFRTYFLYKPEVTDEQTESMTKLDEC
jgi:hypothetical protein